MKNTILIDRYELEKDESLKVGQIIEIQGKENISTIMIKTLGENIVTAKVTKYLKKGKRK